MTGFLCPDPNQKFIFLYHVTYKNEHHLLSFNKHEQVLSTEDESKLALKLRSLKRSGQKIVEVQFTDSQDHLRGSARVKIEDLLYALVEREALLPSYCDRHDSGTCDFLERLEKFGQENNVKLYDIMTFDNITKIKSLLDDAILYKK